MFLVCSYCSTYTTTHDRLAAICPELPAWASTRKVKVIWILLEQETVSGSGITWAICKSAPRSRQITTPAPHHSVLYGPSLPPTNSVNALKADMCSRNLQIMTAAMFSTKHAGFPLSWLQKIPGLFQDLRSIFPGPCRKRAMFKYRDKQRYWTCGTSVNHAQLLNKCTVNNGCKTQMYYMDQRCVVCRTGTWRLSYKTT